MFRTFTGFACAHGLAFGVATPSRAALCESSVDGRLGPNATAKTSAIGGLDFILTATILDDSLVSDDDADPTHGEFDADQFLFDVDGFGIFTINNGTIGGAAALVDFGLIRVRPPGMVA